MAISPTPANSENTTICRISLVAIASMIDLGTMCEMNSLASKALLATPDTASAAGSASPTPTPGASRLTINMPSDSDTIDAVMNHANVRTKVRPTAPPLPIWAMPTTSVDSTSGAMIILISLRKMSVTMPSQYAACLASSADTLRLMA